MRGTRKIKSLALCVGVALALSAAVAASASAELVLKAGGQTIPNGALVNVGMSEKPEFLFKTKIFIEKAPAASEYELECENYLEQGKIEHSAGTWRITATHPVEICEGSPFLEEAFVESKVTLSAAGTATDQSTIELFRNQEELRAEERKQAENGEEIDPREPLRCLYRSTVSKGKFTHGIKKPMIIKLQDKMLVQPVANGTGCTPKGKSRGSYTVTYKGKPVFATFETGPSVSGVSPAEGPEAEGTTVQISGSGFTGASSVAFGATSATSFKVNSDSSITATAPKGSGTVDVTVTTPIGTSAATPADHYSFRAPPTVTEIAPKTGPESGTPATEVTITGTHFTSGSTVKFGTNPASSVTVNSEGSITATAPPGKGTVDVTVTTAGGTSTTSSADQYSYILGA